MDGAGPQPTKVWVEEAKSVEKGRKRTRVKVEKAEKTEKVATPQTPEEEAPTGTTPGTPEVWLH